MITANSLFASVVIDTVKDGSGDYCAKLRYGQHSFTLISGSRESAATAARSACKRLADRINAPTPQPAPVPTH